MTDTNSVLSQPGSFSGIKPQSGAIPRRPSRQPSISKYGKELHHIPQHGDIMTVFEKGTSNPTKLTKTIFGDHIKSKDNKNSEGIENPSE